jgi:hypothetical protein
VTVLGVGLVAAAAEARVRDGCACGGAMRGPPVGAELVLLQDLRRTVPPELNPMAIKERRVKEEIKLWKMRRELIGSRDSLM